MFRLDGQPHEIIIKDTKYYVKELYSADKRNTTQLAVSQNLPLIRVLTFSVDVFDEVLGSLRWRIGWCIRQGDRFEASWPENGRMEQILL